MRKKRLDSLLVEKGYFPSRETAQKIILAGGVQVEGHTVYKPSALALPHAQIEIKKTPKYVSRGGEKLEEAFRAFSISVEGKVAVDLGTSTGGFTHCLLQHGAKKVYAVDVGYGQIALQLRCDPRVELRERTNARYLSAKNFPDAVQFLTADLSFISLKKILPAIASILQERGDAVLLIKPQFEAGKKEAGKGKGVIRDQKIHERVITQIEEEARQYSLESQGIIPSPILGPAGNQEFLLWIIKTKWGSLNIAPLP